MKESTVLRQALGIDVSKDSLSFCLGVLKDDLEKDYFQSEDVSNDTNGFKVLSRWVKSSSRKKELPVVIMEATGVYHEALANYLFNHGYDVCIMQSGRVKKYAQSLDQRSKTDALDSKMLSMLGCERKISRWVPPSKTLEELKFLSRERSSLIKDRNIEKNRIHAKNAASFAYKKAIKRYNKRMVLLNSQIDEIELEMQAITDKDSLLAEKMNYLKSIPGVSFISAVTVVAETLGFSLFSSAKQLVSYSGYDVVLRESGTYKGKSRISKKGNKYIRAVLHMPSMTAIRVNPTLKPFYERLKPVKTKPLIALVAVQRKMLVLMYSLWKGNQYYDANYEMKKVARNKFPATQDSNKIEFETS